MNQIDWSEVGGSLQAFGYAAIAGLVGAPECNDLMALYGDESRFRKRVAMAQHGFGRGEYKYFSYPLPPLVADLREWLYPPLAEIANGWNAALKSPVRFPPTHAGFLKRCHAAGQTRPTPLL